MKKKIVMIGATSTIAEHCAREWAMQSNIELVLVGRNETELQSLARDLNVRAPKTQCNILLAEFNNPESIQNTVDTICALALPDIVLIAHGTLPEQIACQQDLKSAKAAMDINGISPALFAEAFALHMDTADSGTIALIGSVAGDRGRQSNYIYGAAKGLVERYMQGMQHRFYGRNVKIILIKPGPTETKMTAKLKETPLKMASASDVAKLIIQGIQQGKAVIYAPKKWAFIMLIIRHIPNFIFGKMKI